MNITDLNIDCLEKVFRQLDYIDIFNVAESNVHLREAAKLVYRLKYAKREVWIRRDKRNNPIKLEENRKYNVVYINRLKTAFKLLRNFENSISHIRLIGPSESRFKNVDLARLMTYVHQYHFKFLTNITFCGNFGTGIEFNKALESLEIPFFNVKSIEMKGDFGFNKHFPRLFPNIQKIDSSIVKHAPLALLSHHFPRLIHVGFHLYRSSISNLGDPEFLQMIPPMVSFLRLNPQIRSFHSFFIFSEKFLDAINESVPLLENLKLDYSPIDFFNFGGDFENLKRIEFLCRLGHFYDNNMETVAKRTKRFLSFNQIEEFVCSNFRIQNQDFYDILSRYPSIVKLKVIRYRGNTILKKIDPLKLATALPKLAEIVLSSSLLLPNDLILFIRTIKSLKKISVHYNTNRYEDLLKNLPTEWHISKLKLQSITIERKM